MPCQLFRVLQWVPAVKLFRCCSGFLNNVTYNRSNRFLGLLHVHSRKPLRTFLDILNRSLCFFWPLNQNSQLWNMKFQRYPTPCLADFNMHLTSHHSIIRTTKVVCIEDRHWRVQSSRPVRSPLAQRVSSR